MSFEFVQIWGFHKGMVFLIQQFLAHNCLLEYWISKRFITQGEKFHIYNKKFYK
jgi:hypothetical protein